MAVIQHHIVKRGKRPIYRQFFHAKDDEKLVAAWSSDLDEIRRVFEVRSFTPVGRLPTSSFHFQAESAKSTNIGIPDAGDGTSNIHVTASEVRNELVDPCATASDVDCGTPTNNEGDDDRFRAVRNTRNLPVAE